VRDLDEVDGIFYNGDGRQVHCAADLDDRARNSIASIDTALDRAADRGEIVELYAHDPGKTVPLDKLEHVLAGARDRGLTFVTYRQLARDELPDGPGIALSFDDTSIDAWAAVRPMFDQYGAKVTFFVSRFGFVHEAQRSELHALADDGHDIEAHSVLHLNAPEYVEDHGLQAYLDDEALPSIQVLQDEGYDISAYAYPFGARTGELDDALLEHVPLVRSVVFAYYGTVQSPCPH